MLTWSKSSHHWLSLVFLTATPTGGSQTHSPVVRLANMCSPDRGSIISTHSVGGGALLDPPLAPPPPPGVALCSFFFKFTLKKHCGTALSYFWLSALHCSIILKGFDFLVKLLQVKSGLCTMYTKWKLWIHEIFDGIWKIVNFFKSNCWALGRDVGWGDIFGSAQKPMAKFRRGRVF